MAHHQLAYRHERKLKARFAAVRVRVADGPPQRIRDKGQHRKAWVIVGRFVLESVNTRI